MSGIGQRIHSLRLKRALKQDELAQQIGVSRQVLSNWEREYTPPDLNGIIRLGETLNVSMDYLLKGVNLEINEETHPKPEGVASVFSDSPEMLALYERAKDLNPDAVKRLIRYIAIVEEGFSK